MLYSGWFEFLCIDSPPGPLQMLDENNGFTLCNGKLWATSDAGQSWMLAGHAGSLPLLGSVWFADRNRGWAGGDWQQGVTGLRRTVDGGIGWQEVECGHGFLVTDVFFIDESHGWFATADGAVLRTVDGGSSWDASVVMPGTHLSSVRFADRTSGFALGVEVHPPTNKVAIAAYYRWLADDSNYNRNYCQFDHWLGGEWDASAGTVVFRTADGGATWEEVYRVDPKAQEPIFIAVPEPSVCFVSGQRLARIHGGAVELLGTSVRGPLAYIDQDRGCGIDAADPYQERLAFTSDGGRTWSQSSGGTGNRKAFLGFDPRGRAWATAGNYSGTSTVLLSEDCGKSWVQRFFFSSHDAV